MNVQPAKYGFVAALGLAQLVSWGVLYYSFPLIAEAMINDTGISRNSIYGAATAGLLLAAAMAYPVGTLVDRGHGRKIMVGATFAASLTAIMVLCRNGARLLCSHHYAGRASSHIVV